MALAMHCLDCDQDVYYFDWWDRCPRCDGDLGQMRFHTRAHRDPVLIAMAKLAARHAPEPRPWTPPNPRELRRRIARTAEPRKRRERQREQATDPLLRVYR